MKHAFYIVLGVLWGLMAISAASAMCSGCATTDTRPAYLYEYTMSYSGEYNIEMGSNSLYEGISLRTVDRIMVEVENTIMAVESNADLHDCMDNPFFFIPMDEMQDANLSEFNQWCPWPNPFNINGCYFNESHLPVSIPGEYVIVIRWDIWASDLAADWVRHELLHRVSECLGYGVDPDHEGWVFMMELGI